MRKVLSVAAATERCVATAAAQLALDFAPYPVPVSLLSGDSENFYRNWFWSRSVALDK